MWQEFKLDIQSKKNKTAESFVSPSYKLKK
jgi:hypothetical protein